MKIVFFSDSHGQHHQLKFPEADMLICCGDISSVGRKYEVQSFLNWYSGLPHKYKIFIAGNHDFWFEPSHPRNRDLSSNENPRDIIPSNIIYLENETVEIEGIKIFGSPWSPWFHSWAFNAYRGNDIKKHWDLIQEGTDILVVHTPPSGTILDTCLRGERVGCVDLQKKIDEIKPKIVSFGHIHEAYGTESINGIKYINCSVLDINYKLVNNPILLDFNK